MGIEIIKLKMIYKTSLLIFCFYLFSSPSFSQNTDKYSGSVVVELFTSQGDINSPPADIILSEIIADAGKNNQPVYGLSMHVDFWNRYGWKDPFSNFKYTTRLTNYTSVLHLSETYTPMVVINGRNVFAGSESKKIKECIASELAKKSTYFPEFTYQVFDDTLDISYDIKSPLVNGKSGNDKYINVAIVEKGLVTKVTKGDNAGKSLKNDNVTRLFYTTDLKSQKGLIRVPLKSCKPGENKTLIFYIQEKSSKKIIGAASKAFGS